MDLSRINRVPTRPQPWAMLAVAVSVYACGCGVQAATDLPAAVGQMTDQAIHATDGLGDCVRQAARSFCPQTPAPVIAAAQSWPMPTLFPLGQVTPVPDRCTPRLLDLPQLRNLPPPTA